MINVKGTRTEAASAEAADIYAEKEPARRSRTPFIVGALLSAIALYFKTAMSGTAAEQPAAEDAPQNNGEAKVSLAEAAMLLAYGDPVEAADAVSADAPHRVRYSDQTPATFFGASWAPGLTVGPARGMPASSAANINSVPFRPSAEPDALEHMTPFGPASGSDVGPDTSVASLSPGGNGEGRRNSPPKSARPSYMLDVSSGAIVMIALADLLAPLADADGDALAVVDATVSSGTLIPFEGGFLYRSDPGVVGQVDLSYSVTDGHSVTTQVAKLTVAANVATGTAGDDFLSGTAFADDIDGRTGDDQIDAGSGGDVIRGGAGDDRISGGDGNDRLYGDAGDDSILGGNGNDWIWGGAGQDRIFGDAGNDMIFGDAGDDTLSDGTGTDSVAGGDGDDVVLAASDGQGDSFDGGAGTDTLDYSAATVSMRIHTVDGTADGTGIGQDAISGFEIVIAGSGDDVIVAGFDDLVMKGGAGADRFEFAGGPTPSGVIRTIHQILDFSVGDRVTARGFDLFEDVGDATMDLLETLAGNAGSNPQVPQIRVSRQHYDDHDETILEWDSDDFASLMTVILHGNHQLTWAEHS